MEENMEEISLRELIEILIKRKMIIIAITIIAMVTTGVINFLVLDPTYETEAILMASNFNEAIPNGQIEDQSIESILNELSRLPQMNLETYRLQITSPSVLNKTIEELNLESIYNVESLARAINIQTINDTNLIAIRMEHTDAEKASTIVNSVARNSVEFVADMAREQATTASDYVERQMAVEKEKLDKVLIELREFLAQPRSTSELDRELNARLDAITNYKMDLDEEKMKKEVVTTSIVSTESELNNTNAVLTTNQSILEDSLMRDIITDDNDSTLSDISDITVRNEQINPVYLELNSALSNYRIEREQINTNIANLESQIRTTEQQIEALQIELEEKRYRESDINQRVDIAQQTYDAFIAKYEELRVAESSRIGESSITIMSEAFETNTPVGPRKAMNLAIATILGGMIGVFLAFFMEYWKTSEIKHKKKEELK
ncbi:GumC family protein [Natranaerovirga hydrolytica]|nr:Wzz/FepE/Etk N-terminal domain-containing protein [Natranaerovirga hydrolytica]